MTKEEMIDFIKDNLEISVYDYRYSSGDTRIKVSLQLCGEEISRDEFYVYNQ